MLRVEKRVGGRSREISKDPPFLRGPLEQGPGTGETKNIKNRLARGGVCIETFIAGGSLRGQFCLDPEKEGAKKKKLAALNCRRDGQPGKGKSPSFSKSPPGSEAKGLSALKEKKDSR